MKTYPLCDENGKLHAFEIGNLFNGRKRVTRIVSNIPNTLILKRPKLLSWFNEDIFCEFYFKNKSFTIEEPFGDHSRYLIGANPPGYCEELEIIEEVFRNA